VAKTTVVSGICGYQASIQAAVDDNYEVELQITSDCAKIKSLASVLTHVSALHEVGSPISDTDTYQAASRCKLHTACPVPCGVIKTIEVTAGLALPADVLITIQSD
jgi:hypothetical protein